MSSEHEVKWFCDRMDQWATLAGKPGTNLNPGFEAAWNNVRLAIGKSCLLDRMFYGGEQPSQTPCPVHEGVWSGCHWGWPGSISVAVTDHDGYKAGDAFPGTVSAQMQEWYDAGCRCAYHNCGCTTGWQPDAHCGCGGEENRKAQYQAKYGSRMVDRRK